MDNFIYGCIEGSYAQGMQTENSDLDIIEVYNAAIHMEKELKNPDEEDIKEYLSGNLCRCSGYMSQLRAVKKYLDMKQSGKEA